MRYIKIKQRYVLPARYAFCEDALDAEFMLEEGLFPIEDEDNNRMRISYGMGYLVDIDRLALRAFDDCWEIEER